MALSVVIPAFDEESLIEGCVTSVLDQSSPVHEVIVVDNNSTDATADIVRRLAQADSRVTLLQEPRPGVAHARYTGFAHASGDLIASLDSDTRLEPGWVEAVEQMFADNPDVGAATAPVVMRDLPFQKRFRTRNRRLEERARAGLEKGAPVRLPALTGANSVIRREAWDRVRDAVSTRNDIFEDLDLSLHLQEHGVSAVLAPGMSATVSGRRMLAGPRSFVTYAACGTRTYLLHGRRGMAAVATLVNGVTFVSTMAKLPVNRAWDPATQRFSVGRVFGRGIEHRASPIG